jgi:hypothetical protein
MRLGLLFSTLLGSTLLAACGADVQELPGDGAAPGPRDASADAAITPNGDDAGRDAGALPDARSPADSGPDACAAETSPRLGPGSDPCADTWIWACGLPASVNAADGLTADECARACGKPREGSPAYYGCYVADAPDAGGPTTLRCYTCVAGRRPAGFDPTAERVSVASWLSVTAALEWASIDAFQILAEELVALGAPTRLVEAARRAEADEVRHTAAMRSLARAAGAAVSAPAIARGAARDLVALAIENAVEGCVRETYGALVAGHQAAHAARSDVRAVMRVVHEDETRHAELAWDVHAWAMAGLGAEDQSRVLTAMRGAFDELAREASVFVSAELVRDLGLPGVRASRAFASALREHLVPLAAAA